MTKVKKGIQFDLKTKSKPKDQYRDHRFLTRTLKTVESILTGPKTGQTTSHL